MRRRIAVYQLDNYRFSPFGRNFRKLAAEIMSRGIDVDLLITNPNGLNDVPDGVACRVIGWKDGPSSVPAHLRAIRELAAYLRLDPPDALICRGVPFAISAIAARLVARARVKIIVSLHIPLTFEIEKRMHRSSRFYPYILPWAFRHVDAVVAVSEGVAADYSMCTAVPMSRFSIIHHAVVTDEELTDSGSSDLLHPWIDTPGEAKIIVSIGRLDVDKNFALLLEAISLVSRSHDVKCLIIGEGKLRPQLEASIEMLALQDRVALLGRVNEPSRFLRKADLFVLSSNSEGLPNVMIEALTARCPVVSTDVPGAAEILDHGRMGEIVVKGSPSELADGIRRELQRKREPAELKQCVLKYHVRNAADRYIDLIYGSQRPSSASSMEEMPRP